MALRQTAPPYPRDGVTATQNPADESDAEEDTMVADYREQAQYDGDMDQLTQTTSFGGAHIGMSTASGAPDLHAQLAAAATPLEFQASLETKFASYDNYCSLFHFILNSDGPVDLEVPSVSEPNFHWFLLLAQH